MPKAAYNTRGGQRTAQQLLGVKNASARKQNWAEILQDSARRAHEKLAKLQARYKNKKGGAIRRPAPRVPYSQSTSYRRGKILNGREEIIKRFRNSSQK